MFHFETLWEEAEKLLKDETSISSAQELVKEAMAKFAVLDKLSNIQSFSNEELIRLKTNTFGKLLLVLSQISLKDNINVYAAMKAAVDDRKISIFEAKYK